MEVKNKQIIVAYNGLFAVTCNSDKYMYFVIQNINRRSELVQEKTSILKHLVCNLGAWIVILTCTYIFVIQCTCLFSHLQYFTCSALQE